MSLRGKPRDASRKVTPPSPSYMSNDQFSTYISTLRTNRVARPGGARPLPPSSTSIRRESRNDSISSQKQQQQQQQQQQNLPYHPQQRERLSNEFSDASGPSASAASIGSGRPSIGTSVAPSMSSRYSTVSGRGRDYYPDKKASTAKKVSPPLRPDEVVPTDIYMERGQRWMEKEEAVSLRKALEDMDRRKASPALSQEDKADKAKQADDNVNSSEDESRIYNAALDEAAELVWQHQHGIKPPEAGTPYAYKQHLRKDSYAYARTASVGRYGNDIEPSGLARDHPAPVPTSRSVSGSSASSHEGGSVRGSVRERGVRVPSGQGHRKTGSGGSIRASTESTRTGPPVSMLNKSKRNSLGSSSTTTSSSTSTSGSRTAGSTAVPARSKYAGLASGGPKPMAVGSSSTAAGTARRRSSMKRNISGEIEKPFSGDQIYEEPETATASKKTGLKEIKASSSMSSVSVLRAAVENKVRSSSNNSAASDIRKMKIGGRTSSATAPTSSSLSKLVSRYEIHRNPPSQSRNPEYTTNTSEKKTQPSDNANEDGEAEVTSNANTENAVPRINGVEIRSEDIRQATSMKLKDRNPKLPTPSFVSDNPGRPIVSFDAKWKPREEDEEQRRREEQVRKEENQRKLWGQVKMNDPGMEAATDAQPGPEVTARIPASEQRQQEQQEQQHQQHAQQEQHQHQHQQHAEQEQQQQQRQEPQRNQTVQPASSCSPAISAASRSPFNRMRNRVSPAARPPAAAASPTGASETTRAAAATAATTAASPASPLSAPVSSLAGSRSPFAAAKSKFQQHQQQQQQQPQLEQPIRSEEAKQPEKVPEVQQQPKQPEPAREQTSPAPLRSSQSIPDSTTAARLPKRSLAVSMVDEPESESELQPKPLSFSKPSLQPLASNSSTRRVSLNIPTIAVLDEPLTANPIRPVPPPIPILMLPDEDDDANRPPKKMINIPIIITPDDDVPPPAHESKTAPPVPSITVDSCDSTARSTGKNQAGSPSVPIIVTPDRKPPTSVSAPTMPSSASTRPLPTPASQPRSHWSRAPAPVQPRGPGAHMQQQRQYQQPQQTHQPQQQYQQHPQPSSRPLPLPGSTAGSVYSGGGVSRSAALCHECGLSIEGRFVALASKSGEDGSSKGGERFHPHCFRCHACGTGLEALEISPEPEEARAARLAEGSDPDLRLRFFCHLDWHELYAPRCRHCTTPIVGEHVVALGHHWHVGHFFCAECGDPFGPGATHIEKDGYAWCVGCQTRRTERRAPRCRACGEPAIGAYVRALGAEWHDACFRCGVCQGGFADGQVFPREGKAGLMQVVCTGCRQRELKA